MSAPRPAWMKKIRVGDVLTRDGRNFRVVRHLSRRADGSLIAVTFAIKHRSWTGRPDTVYMANDLATLAFRPAGVRVPLRSAIDRRFARYLKSHHFKRGPFPLTPDDVRGIA